MQSLTQSHGLTDAKESGMLRLLVASLSLLPVLALAPPSWAGEQADHDDTLMRTSDCAALFEGVDQDDAKEHREARVLRLVEKDEGSRKVVSIEHTVSTWSTPLPLQFGDALRLVEILEEADLEDEAEPEAAATPAAAAEEAGNDAANDVDGTDEAPAAADAEGTPAAPADDSAKEAKNDEPGGRAAIFELAQDMGNCRAGRYIVERDDTLGQGSVVLEVLQNAVLVDSGDSLSMVRTAQSSRTTDVQLVWVSSFELVIEESAKGLNSSGKSTKKNKRKKRSSRKKKKKRKKKKRSKRK